LVARDGVCRHCEVSVMTWQLAICRAGSLSWADTWK
jgi:hypothetical protein